MRRLGTNGAGMTGEAKSLWRRFRATRDPDLRDDLIRQHIGLVRKVAGRLAFRLPAHVHLEDLEAAGIPGLLMAIEGYDPERDVEFAAYAQQRIRGAILDELRGLDPLPRSLREKARKMEAAMATLQQRLLRAPADDEVAEFLAIPLETFHRFLYELRGGLQVSLDAGRPVGEEDDDGEGGAPSVPEEHTPNPWQALAIKERRALLGAIIEDLPAAERTVLSLYYYEELTMKEIGAVLEVSESRVSQIHSAALLRIRARLRRKRLGSEDLCLEERAHSGQSELVRA
jgi:RNA polymerase sigma factor for flagellar operon FliA